MNQFKIFKALLYNKEEVEPHESELTGEVQKPRNERLTGLCNDLKMNMIEYSLATGKTSSSNNRWTGGQVRIRLLVYFKSANIIIDKLLSLLEVVKLTQWLLYSNPLPTNLKTTYVSNFIHSVMLQTRYWLCSSKQSDFLCSEIAWE